MEASVHLIRGSFLKPLDLQKEQQQQMNLFDDVSARFSDFIQKVSLTAQFIMPKLLVTVYKFHKHPYQTHETKRTPNLVIFTKK